MSSHRRRLRRSERRARLEAEQVRRQLDVLAQVTAPLAPALDHPEEAIDQITAIVVPQLADLFAVDLVRSGGELERVVGAYRDTELERAADAARGAAAPAGWADGLLRVIEAGRSELTYTTPDGGLSATGGSGLDDLMRGLGMQSWVVAPIRAGGHALGAMTVAVGPERRGYRPADQATIDDLAARCSMAFERALLYQEARDAAEAARRGEQRLQTLVEASPLAILEVDRSGEVRLANPAARALPSPLPQALLDYLERQVAGEVPETRQEIEIATGGADGDPDGRILRVSTARLVDPDGAHVIAVVADVTARKRLEDQLTRAQRFEALASLAGGVAHDFNNLLTVILGYSGLLLHGLDEDAPEREQLEAIQDAGNHAAVITNQLLSLSRHQVLQPETIDPAARCAALLPMLRRLAGDDVTVEVRRTGAGRIRVDPGQLEQVVFNLVINSRDALATGGTVVVEAGEVVRDAGDDAVVVRVTDDGEGMDAATLARCQEPFFTTKGRNRGTGLGLATVASILERSGGTFALTSELGVGTTATARFPGVAAPAPTEGPAEVAPARVLLVDDEEQVRTFAASVLAGAGYDVVAVGDAERALDELGRGGFALLVTDVILPGTSGIDLVRTVRSRWPEVASIVISGFTGTQPFDRAELGDTVLVAKPFTPEALLRAAAAVLLTGSSAAR